MYLTRMPLDVKRHSTMKALSSPNLLHGAVERAFSGERKRNLWRVDCLNGTWYLLIVSEEKPDLAEAARQFGDEHADAPWETKDYSALLKRIEEDGRWHFRLTANPTISTLPHGEEADAGRQGRGKVCACLSISQQKKWLMDRARKHGFEVEEDGFDVVGKEWIRFQKKGKGAPVTILSVTYEGVLRVTDKDLFRQALEDGIGRGKAYGMGMLTIATIKADAGGKNE